MGSGNTDNSKLLNIEEVKLSQMLNLRLQILLLFYDDKRMDKNAEYKDEEVEDNDYSCIVQYGDICANTSFKISGVKEDVLEKIETRRICIPEKFSGDKKKDKKVLEKYQIEILCIIISYYCKLEYKEIYVDFLIPKDNDSGVVESIYELFLLDKKFIDSIKGLINLKKSSISILHENNRLQEDIDEFGSIDNKPNDIDAKDAKIAALMSHYVYFYLDWLEYVHVHVAAYNFWDHDLKKYKTYKVEKSSSNTGSTEEESIIKEFNNLISSGPSQIFQPGASRKVKARVVGRLKEIAKIVNYSSTIISESAISNAINSYITDGSDKIVERLRDDILGTDNIKKYGDSYKNAIDQSIKEKLDELKKTKIQKDLDTKKLEFGKLLDEVAATSVYVYILLESKREGRPVGFYDLYDKFGYWDYLNDTKLQNEAKKWYVSHPYLVFKNDYEKIYNHNIVKDTNPVPIPGIIINDDSIEAYNKFLAIIPRKTQNIYIYKNKYKYNADYNKWIATGDYLIYNTVLTHGMDQISGYGGLLFTKVELDIKKKILKPLKFAYCTKGTDVNSFNDWVFVDILQGVSGFSLQHVHNVKNAITINEKINDLSKKLEREIPLFFCGHSLGGGLASAGAIASKGRHAITFNAAGLNFLGVIATRTVGGFNYSFKTPDMVHPIRIDGEAIDWLMVYSRLLTGLLNERAYGRPELIFKLKDSDKWDTSEKGSKHGINNFLYKPLMNALEIVSKKTIKQPLGKDTSIATLGLDNAVFQKIEIKRSDIEKGSYTITFEDVNLNIEYVSICKFSLSECLEWFVNIDKNIETFLRENVSWERP